MMSNTNSIRTTALQAQKLYKTTMKLQQKLQAAPVQSHQSNTQYNMDTAQATYNDTTEYRLNIAKGKQTGKIQKKKMQKQQLERKLKLSKMTQQLYEYAAYARSERTIPGSTENVTRKSKHSKVSAQCK